MGVLARLIKMARRFQSRARISGPRRQTNWIGGVNVQPTDETALPTGAQIVASFDTRLNESLAPFTIVRMLGKVTLVSTAASNIFAQGAFGVCVVNGEAFDAGIASLITPWTEAFDDRWLVHQYWQLMSVAGTGSVTNVWSQEQLLIDSKAMRKVNDGDVVVWVIQNASTDAVSFMANLRMLIKLH